MKNYRIFTLAFTAAAAIGLSTASFAEPPAHAKNGKAKVRVEHVQKVKPNNVPKPGRNTVIIRDNNDVIASRCPPGLAKKSPSCIPPGQAKKWGVGDVIDWDDVHIVTQPGYYGLSTPPYGDRYAIIDGQLVRVNRDSGQILSILRVVDAILD